MSNHIDLAALKQLAAQAQAVEGQDERWWNADEIFASLANPAVDCTEADAAFIAACSPDVVTALTRAVRAAQALSDIPRGWVSDPYEQATRELDAALAPFREKT